MSSLIRRVDRLEKALKEARGPAVEMARYARGELRVQELSADTLELALARSDEDPAERARSRAWMEGLSKESFLFLCRLLMDESRHETELRPVYRAYRDDGPAAATAVLEQLMTDGD